MKTKLMVDKCFLKLATIAIAGILQGCSFLGVGQGDFSCPGGIEGVRCMSARQVYQATESSDTVKMVSEDDKSDNKKNPDRNSGQSHASQVAVPSIKQPIPIRTQAKVMRIWMAPWEDEEGDLHADGYLYTEIESRRWNLGDQFKSPGAAQRPLSAATPSKDAK